MMTAEQRYAFNLLAQYGITPSSIALIRALATDTEPSVASWLRLLGSLTQAQLSRLMDVSAPVISRRVKAESDSGGLVVHRLRSGRGGRPVNVATLPGSPVPTQATIDAAESIVAAVLIVLIADHASGSLANSVPDPDLADIVAPVVNTPATSPTEVGEQLCNDEPDASAKAAAIQSMALDSKWPPARDHAPHAVAHTWPGADPLLASHGGSDYLNHHSSDSIPPVVPWNAYRAREHIQPVQVFRPSIGERLVWAWQRVSYEMIWRIRDVRWWLYDRTAEWNTRLLILIVLAICVVIVILWLGLHVDKGLATPVDSVNTSLYTERQCPDGIVFIAPRSAKTRNQPPSLSEKDFFSREEPSFRCLTLQYGWKMAR